jgi:hypothetical protein
VRTLLLLTLALPLLILPLHAQKNNPKQPDPRTSSKATVIRPTTLYIQADTGSDKIGTLTPGREMAILEGGGQGAGQGGGQGNALNSGQGAQPGADHPAHWLHVYANTDEETVRQADQPVFSDQRASQPISGWIEATNAIAADTPQGEAILFGEAISFEQAASAPHPPADAAQSARRLYRMTAELFPNDARTPEALWRSADIRWQLQKQDAATLPSAHEKEAYLRQQPDEAEMKRIEKQYSGSKWASYAAYDLIDNKLCGDWQGSEKCPEQEAGYYAKFADQYPDSPRAPQALYEAAWRLACAGDMWSADNDDKRAADDRKHSIDTAGHLLTKYETADYAARGAGLIYKVEHSIPVYGSDRQ